MYILKGYCKWLITSELLEMTIENGLKKYVLPFGRDCNHRLPSGSEDHISERK